MEVPRHLVPDQIVVVEELPLTATGKIDRSSLPMPDAAAEPADCRAGLLLPRTPIERELHAIYARVLSVEALSIDDNFFALGGNSLQLAEIAGLVYRAFGVDLPVSAMFERPSVVELARVIAPGVTSESAQPHHIRRLKLEPDIRRTTKPGLVNGGPKSVFLTGSTGFLGRYLLREFLVATDVKVYCAAREQGAMQAPERIMASLGRLGSVANEWRQRIIPVPCDLKKPLLGLDEPSFDKLAGSIDVVCHNGAKVSAMETYADLFVTNSLGTQEIIRLASRSARAGVHFVSTAAVTDSFEGDGVLADRADVKAPKMPDDAYVASKRVAEDLIWQSHGRGIPGAVYRPSLICGPAGAPLSGSDAQFWHIVQLMLEMQAVPDVFEDGTSVLNVIPVDQVARLIVRGVSSLDCYGQTFHLTSPDPIAFATVFDMLRDRGFVLKTLPIQGWRRRLVDHISSNRDIVSPHDVGLADTLIEFERLGRFRFCHDSVRRSLAADLSDEFFQIRGGALASETLAALGLNGQRPDFKDCTGPRITRRVVTAGELR